MPLAEHKSAISTLWREGKTLQQIGDTYDVSRERVRQLLRHWKIDRKEGGSYARRLITAIDRHSKVKEKHAQKREHEELYFGCDEDSFRRICGPDATFSKYKKTISLTALAYVQQRTNARNRGIDWKLTLPQWWQIWQDSGKWKSRGRGRGKFVMGRFGDCGSYETNNVYIVEFVQNCMDYYSVPSNKEKWRKSFDARRR